jgi:hypothetical protein
MWTSISLLLLLIYILYRRRQNKTNGEQTSEENAPVRESSEYRLSSVQPLPTIVEENPTTLSSSNSDHNFTPTSPTSPLALGTRIVIIINHHHFLLISDEKDNRHLSSTSLRQRKVEKTDIDDIDDFVQISPIIKEKPYYINKDSAKLVQELPSLINETAHPVIFRMFVLRKFFRIN